MKPSLIIGLLCSTAVSAQKVADRSQLGSILTRLDPQGYDQKLSCEVEPIKPALNFGFRFQAGYVFRVAMNQYTGPNHEWVVVTRITPEPGNRQPTYLLDSIKFSIMGGEVAKGEAGGAYWLGEGHYSVTWTLLDDLGRVCRKEWQIDAVLSRGDRKLGVTIPANTVAELSSKGSAPSNRQAGRGAPMRLTVLLDAAPLALRRTSAASLDASDQLLLLGSLSEMLDLLPTSSVRLVVFSLEQQRELFRRDGFTLEALDQVGQALNDLNLRPVDYRVLQNRKGHLSLLLGLINEEIRSTLPSDAVVFLGAQERYRDKIPEDALEKLHESGPRFFYLQCRSVPQLVKDDRPDHRFEDTYRIAAPDPFDSISMAMKNLRGQSLPVYSPAGFMKAVEQVDRQVPRDH